MQDEKEIQTTALDHWQGEKDYMVCSGAGYVGDSTSAGPGFPIGPLLIAGAIGLGLGILLGE